MLKDLARRLGAGLVAAFATAVAAGIVLVAAAFAAYAGLKTVVSPAAASALTALAFAALVALIAVLAPRLIRGKPAPARKVTDTGTLRGAAEFGVAALGVVGDLAEARRLKRQEQARNRKRRPR